MEDDSDNRRARPAGVESDRARDPSIAGWLVASVVFLAVLTGCPGIMAPPARHTSLHGADAVRPGHTEIQVSGSGHVAHALYPSSGGVSGSLDLRAGLSDHVGAQLGGTAFRIFAADTPERQWRGYLFSGRGGVEFHPKVDSPIALEFGVGGGSSLAGTYVAPDFGFVVSSDVEVFQLVFGASLYGSFPITRRAVGNPPLTGEPTRIGGGGGIPVLPDRPTRGAGGLGRVGINSRILEPTDRNPGLVLRSALGTTSGVDVGNEEEDIPFVGRADVWLAVGVALEL